MTLMKFYNQQKIKLGGSFMDRHQKDPEIHVRLYDGADVDLVWI